MFSALQSAGGGGVAALISLAYAFSYGALIFSGPLQPFLAQGIAAALVTTAVTATLVALTSNFPAAIAGPDNTSGALMAAMMMGLAPSLSAMPPERALGTAAAVLAGTAFLTGLSLFVLGWCRFGKLIRFIPYPVMAGFLAATGLLMVSGALRMATGTVVSLATIPQFTERETLLLSGLTVIWAGCLWVLTAKIKHVLALPVSLGGTVLATHLALPSLAKAGFAIPALFFPAAAAGGKPVMLLLDGAALGVDWPVLLQAGLPIAAVAVMTALSILLNSTGIELATGEEADLDHELRTQGLVNLASAVSGGFVGHLALNRTLIHHAAGGVSRFGGVLVGLVALGVLLGGGHIIAYIPRFVLAGLLLQLGAKLIVEWGWESRRGLRLADWMVVLAIMAITTLFGFLQALLFGILAGCVFFVFDVSRIRAIRHVFGLDERASSILRSREEMAVLAQHGGSVIVLQLTGYLFFGSAYSLQQQVKALAAEKRPAAICFDFSEVSGMDSSAGASFAKTKVSLRKAGITQIMAGLPPKIRQALSGTQGLDDGVECHDTLDHALEMAEESLLAAHGNTGSVGQSLLAWLETEIRSREFAIEFMLCLKPAACDGDRYLCRQGDPTDTLLFIERGPVSVILERPGQPPLRVRVFGAHTLAGEIGFFLDAPRTASLQAGPEAIVWSLNRSDFRELQETRAELAAALVGYVLRLQSERLTFANRLIAALQR